jgi:hypothetical protein
MIGLGKFPSSGCWTHVRRHHESFAPLTFAVRRSGAASREVRTVFCGTTVVSHTARTITVPAGPQAAIEVVGPGDVIPARGSAHLCGAPTSSTVECGVRSNPDERARRRRPPLSHGEPFHCMQFTALRKRGTYVPGYRLACSPYFPASPRPRLIRSHDIGTRSDDPHPSLDGSKWEPQGGARPRGYVHQYRQD